jgi:type VI secretion system protein ImpE
MLEAIVDSKYYWIPFCRIKKLFVPKPTDLRDLVWAPVQFIWANGGEASGHIPCRYAGTEATTDDALRLARKTEWNAPAEGLNLGLGQRVLATDAEDIPLLECGSLELQPLPSEE